MFSAVAGFIRLRDEIFGPPGSMMARDVHAPSTSHRNSKQQVLVFYSKWDPSDKWIKNLHLHLPSLEVRVYPDIGNPEDIEYALVYDPPPGFLASLPSLKCILSIAAGTDHITKDVSCPNLPVHRMMDSFQRAQMAEYAVHSILHFHRDFHIYEKHMAQVFRLFLQPASDAFVMRHLVSRLSFSRGPGSGCHHDTPLRPTSGFLDLASWVWE